MNDNCKTQQARQLLREWEEVSSDCFNTRTERVCTIQEVSALLEAQKIIDEEFCKKYIEEQEEKNRELFADLCAIQNELSSCQSEVESLRSAVQYYERNK